jgi:ferric-dicitrate binding protein FerR (iron transport regulator)
MNDERWAKGTATRQAARKLVDFEAGDLIESNDLDDWETWLASPDNLAEYSSVVKLKHAFSTLPQPTLPHDDALKGDFASLVDPYSAPEVSRLVKRPSLLRWFPQTPLALAAVWAGTLAIAVGLTFLVYFWRKDFTTDPGQTYATGPAEQHEFRLADGSSMTLGGDTSVHVSFTARGRLIVLSHGEGVFRVARDRDRPFSVCAAEGCTTAVGTVFDVRLYSNHVRVYVQEGAVKVSPFAPVSQRDTQGSKQAAQWSDVQLDRGHVLSYTADQRSTGLDVAEAQDSLSWTSGSLIYKHRALQEVIEDVQRYSLQRIHLDPAAEKLSYSGLVLQAQLDEWLQGLSQIFPVTVVDCQNRHESQEGSAGAIASPCVSDSEGIFIQIQEPTRS